MSNRNILTIIILAMLAALLIVIPAAAQAITETTTFTDEISVFPDVDFCGAGDVMVTVIYSGVLHTTEFTEDDPNAGTFHGLLKIHGTVTTVDQDGNIVSNDHTVKTIFHTNVNRQNLNDRFNFIVNGTRADGSRHRYHLDGHINLSASGNPVTFTHLSISCP
jgi:hypothetical protein